MIYRFLVATSVAVASVIGLPLVRHWPCLRCLSEEELALTSILVVFPDAPKVRLDW
jgi:hypothetical protein